MPEDITAKQHYVPQFYLRQWTDEDGGFYPAKVEQAIPPKVSILKKSGPAAYCFENFFYAQKTGVVDEMSQLVEKGFAEIEKDFAQQLPIIESKFVNREQILDEEKYLLSQLMIFLYFRGKGHRNQSTRQTDDMMQKILKMQVKMGDKDIRKLMSEQGLTEKEMLEQIDNLRFDFGNAHHMQLLKDWTGFSNLLFHKFWRVYISQRGEFITSDNPVIDNPLSKQFYGNDFLSREHTFVLSPRVMICAQRPSNDGGKKIIRKDLTGDKARINLINALSMMRSVRFSFHADEDILKDAIEMAKMYHQFESIQQQL